MNLNQIQLNARLIADLYAEGLIEPSHQPSAEKHELKYLGDFQKQILVLVDNPSIVYMEDHELRFLTNILAACRLSLADIATVNKARVSETDLGNFMEKESPTYLLLFGVSPLSIGLPMNFPEFQIQKFNNRTYLYLPELKVIEKEKSLKTRLWTSLKTLFGIT